MMFSTTGCNGVLIYARIIQLGETSTSIPPGAKSHPPIKWLRCRSKGPSKIIEMMLSTSSSGTSLPSKACHEELPPEDVLPKICT